jgi:4-oxalocrotonate tautomerase
MIFSSSRFTVVRLKQEKTMPYINIKVAGPTISALQISQLQTGITQLMAKVLKKKAELTSVLVEKLDIQGWSIGGTPVKLAAHVNANITEETNTEEQKSQFIAEANALLKSVLGTDLPTATYVVIQEVKEEAWGYDGVTQSGRRPQKSTRIQESLQQLWHAHFVKSGWEAPLP